MKIYRVGGAVRDRLLGIPVTDVDYVVVGATATDMLDRGYQQVGKDFPVFLHPQTKAEYALARTERKSGRGYHGFTINAAPTVTLEEDLQRRDLTINAMAEDETGHIIDPYHGQQDLSLRILRHVSDAFIEDPLRVLRVARFAARFDHLGFKVAAETLELMRKLASELDSLSPERVWLELTKALATEHPHIFFEVLAEAKALSPWFNEFSDVTARAQLRSVFKVRDSADRTNLELSYLSLVSPLSKEQVKRLNQRLRVPKELGQRAEILVDYPIYKTQQLDAELFIELIERNDMWRKPERLTAITRVWHRLGLSESILKSLRSIHEQALKIDAQAILNSAEGELSGRELGAAIKAARRDLISAQFTRIQK
ncbi:hypothetical protein [Pseudidiomarina taiwanensis]|uniref:Uncharacterized protein n=1 Tax=Pseudidiomarina taiwanensis TaxID=337250 RepID=A0A432ZP75_9GAMM|nr:hypothetical protein [Pseudidiomarina taiwanensis]RUO79661.1 hypothetical protein CWI83_00170 [Pseudidiomarina taiwanensis]